jgi:hypothetical protein
MRVEHFTSCPTLHHGISATRLRSSLSLEMVAAAAGDARHSALIWFAGHYEHPVSEFVGHRAPTDRRIPRQRSIRSHCLVEILEAMSSIAAPNKNTFITSITIDDLFAWVTTPVCARTLCAAFVAAADAAQTQRTD